MIKASHYVPEFQTRVDRFKAMSATVNRKSGRIYTADAKTFGGPKTGVIVSFDPMEFWHACCETFDGSKGGKK